MECQWRYPPSCQLLRFEPRVPNKRHITQLLSHASTQDQQSRQIRHSNQLQSGLDLEVCTPSGIAFSHLVTSLRLISRSNRKEQRRVCLIGNLGESRHKCSFLVVTNEDLRTKQHKNIRPRIQLTMTRPYHRPRSRHRLSVNYQRDHVVHIHRIA